MKPRNPTPGFAVPQDSDSPTSFSPTADSTQLVADAVHLVHVDADLAQQRSAELDAVLSQMRAVAALSHQMHSLVAHHGTLLDRIDYNLEHASVSTKRAVAAIQEQADFQVAFDQKKVTLLLLVVLIIFVAIAVIMKPSR